MKTRQIRFLALALAAAGAPWPPFPAPLHAGAVPEPPAAGGMRGWATASDGRSLDFAPTDAEPGADLASSHPNAGTSAPDPEPPLPPAAPDPGDPDGDDESGDPVSLKAGAVLENATDLFVECPGMDLAFERAYDSGFRASRDLPAGWAHNWEWKIVPYASTNGDWMVMRALAGSGGGGCYQNFKNLGDGRWGVSDNGRFVLAAEPGGTWLVRGPGPTFWRFAADGWLSSATARTGESVVVDRGTDRRHVRRVSHSCGASLEFEYEGDALRAVVAPDGSRVAFSRAVGIEGDPRVPGPGETLHCVVTATNSVMRVSPGGETASMSYVSSEERRTTLVAERRVVRGGAMVSVPVRPHFAGATNSVPMSCKIDENGNVVSYVWRRHADSPLSRVVRVSAQDGFFEAQYRHGPGSTEEIQYRGNGETARRVHFYDSETMRTVEVRKGNKRLSYAWTPQGDVGICETTDSSTGSRLVRRFSHGTWHNATNSVFSLDAVPDPADAWCTEWDPEWLLPQWTVSPEGRKTGWVRDDVARTVAICGAGPDSPRLRTVVQCDGNWRPVSATNANGASVSFVYGGDGRLSGVRRPGLPDLDFGYDALGHACSAALPGPDGTVRATVSTNNPFGLPLRIDHPDGTSESFSYDGTWRRPVCHVDELGRTNRYEWLFGVPVRASRTTAAGAEEIRLCSVRTDKQLDLRTVVDPAGRDAEVYVLDSQGRVSCVTNLEGQVEAFHYRIDSLVDRIDRFDGTTVAIDRDSQANVSSVSYPGETLSFSHDRDGLLLGASNSVGVVSASYDETGRTTDAVGADGTPLFYAYHDGGQIASVTLGGAASSSSVSRYWTLDGSDRVASVATPQTEFAYSYCGWNGLVSAVTNSAGISCECAYDLCDRATNVVWRDASGAEIASFGYERDAAGRIIARTFGDASRPAVWSGLQPAGFSQPEPKRVVYGYDAVDRLVREAEEYADGETGILVYKTRRYDYDLAGNRTNFVADSAPGDGAESVVLAYDGANRILSRGAVAYAHDAAGCVTSISGGAGATPAFASGRRLVWNSRYQLVRVEDGAGALLESYAYDALGRRVSTTDACGSTTFHVYDGMHCIADVSESGVPVVSYVWGPGVDNLLAVVRHGSGGAAERVLYAVTDHQGTVHALVDSSGAAVERYRYDAWGNVTRREPLSSAPSAPFNRFLFHGREYSYATGFYNFRARWYDPAAGRWLSKDPIGLAGGLNLYEFCGNDPANFIDCSGCKKSVYDVNKQKKKIRDYLDNIPNPNSVLNPVKQFENKKYMLKGALKFHSGGGELDFKVTQQNETWEVPGVGTMKSDEFGNYLAGYYAGYSGSPLIFFGMRLGGIWYASMGRDPNDGLLDQGSLGDIMDGYWDGYTDR